MALSPPAVPLGYLTGDGDGLSVITQQQQPCCGSTPYDPATQCCIPATIFVPAFPLPKNPIPDSMLPEHFPDRVQEPTRRHEYDGCTNVPDCAFPGDNPEACYSHTVCAPTQNDGLCTGACDVHDRCYQTCRADKNECDGLLLSTALDHCTFSAAYDLCRRLAIVYFGGLQLGGAEAYYARQRQYCRICP